MELKISLSIAGISIQPSEFVKILFVFFVAGMLYQDTSFQRVCVTTVIAAIHVLILVASRDLGAALLFFVTYVVMLYVATKKLLYFAADLPPEAQLLWWLTIFFPYPGEGESMAESAGIYR